MFLTADDIDALEVWTWRRTLRRSRGAVAVREAAPATPPAIRYLLAGTCLFMPAGIMGCSPMSTRYTLSQYW